MEKATKKTTTSSLVLNYHQHRSKHCWNIYKFTFPCTCIHL